MLFQQRLLLILLSVLFCEQLSAQQSDGTAKKLPPQLPLAQWQCARTLDVKRIALNFRFDWLEVWCDAAEQAIASGCFEQSPKGTAP